MKLDPGNLAKDLLTRARIHWAAGDLVKADSDCLQALNRASTSREGYALRGQIALAGGHVDRGIVDLQRARALGDRDPYFLSDLGWAYHLQGRFDKEFAAYNMALEHDADNAWILNRRGLAHFRAGDFDAALGDLTKAIAKSPDYAEAYRNRATVFDALKKSDLAAADWKKEAELKSRQR
jgi:tetratricopeptide (TPR) repeat protein